MWEIFSNIQTPYVDMTSSEVRRKRENIMLFGRTSTVARGCLQRLICCLYRNCDLYRNCERIAQGVLVYLSHYCPTK